MKMCKDAKQMLELLKAAELGETVQKEDTLDGWWDVEAFSVLLVGFASSYRPNFRVKSKKITYCGMCGQLNNSDPKTIAHHQHGCNGKILTFFVDDATTGD